ncbi:hypothetical protein [Flavobacterium sinopsychrotolerans]|nr:hypothetical protein [Flavobacterium sinopsychrotolerans]
MNNYFRLKKCARFYWLVVEVITVGKNKKLPVGCNEKMPYNNK